MGQGDTERPALSDAEWEVMKALWQDGAMAMGDIHSRVIRERDWAYSTVKTIVRRLVEKGWVDYRQMGNSFLYRPAVPRQRAVRRAVREFSRRVLDGVLSPFVAYFAEEEEITEADLRQLEDLIRRHREGKGE
jgi:BlaI family penicillinase repressor